MRILLISVFFPPQNAIASQRAYSWAKYWGRSGENVTVLTPTKDLSRSDLSPQTQDGFLVREVEPRSIFGTLKRWVRGSFEKTGSIASSSAQATKSNSASLWSRFIAMLVSRGLFSSTRLPDAFDLWIWPALKVAQAIECDIVVSTFGPRAPHEVAYRLKKARPGLIWICDFRDLWVHNHNYVGLPGFRCFEKYLECKYIRACDVVTTVSEPLAAELRRDYPGADVRVLPNGFDLDDLAKIPLERAFADDGFKRIVYTGSVNPATQDPSPFFAALAELKPEFRNRVRMIFVGPNTSKLAPLVETFQLGELVEFRLSIPRLEALRLQRDADRLLFLEANYESARDGVLTGKLFEYLSSGTPIIGVGVGSLSTVGRLLKQFDAGEAFGVSVERLRHELETCLSELSRDQQTLDPRLLEYSRERQAENLRQVMKAKVK